MVAKLEVNPGLRATTLFNYLRFTYRGKFREGQLRTLQRRVKQWRGQHGPSKGTSIRQEYVPNKRSQSDFTTMNKLNVTIQGQPFKHMLYHIVLPSSGWASATVCVSESFEALSAGLQNALMACGGVPKQH